MVYCALQLVTRGRDRGISVVELGRKTRYDQKTCFYVVQQLERMELMYVDRSVPLIYTHLLLE